MATIPTLIITPAILAAGIAYKYTSGEGPETSDMRRFRSEMDTTRSRTSGRTMEDEDVSSTQALGKKFEQDSQPRVSPQPRQLANTFIPTSVLVSGMALQAQPVDDSSESSSDSSQQDSRSLSLRKALYGMSGGPTELAPDQACRYPRTTDEIEQTSWLQRAARSITGDLGPIEHQERVTTLQQAGDPHRSTDHGVAGPRYFARDSVNDARNRLGSMKKEVDRDINQNAIEALSSTTQAFDETQGWFWSAKKSVDDAAASVVDDVRQTANEVAESTKDAADKTRGWFWAKKKEVDDDVNQMSSDLKDYTKQAYDETQNWLQSKKQEADDVAQGARRRASDMSDSAKQATEEARDRLASKKQEAEEATAAAAQDIKRRASDASDSAKQAANSTWSWLWSKKKEVDDTAITALDSAKEQAQSARDSAVAKSQQAKEALDDAAETASDWVATKKKSADDAMATAADTARETADSARDWVNEKKSSAADSARQSASNARDWAENTKDDIANSIGRADDASRAWLWNAKGQVDQAVADTAGAFQQQAEAASNSAYESADAASRSYWQRGLGSGTSAGWRGPSAGPAKEDSTDSSLKQRRDSLLSGIDDNAIIHTLDEKFNEARSMLRSTAGEIKTMANDASSAASETLRTAAEKTLPRPSSDGIIMNESDDGSHRDNQAQFVESNSHIPLLSSSPHKRT
ncbi:hypothetical protein IW152_004821 [Coemansia sp. BCRC 34962]|nr:hypothetical protein IW152_004821 [Coemansia sp. BCRC 34962]